MTTTLVEIKPGGGQRAHQHAPEQIYFILKGSDLMTVGTVARQAGAGDCILVPSGDLNEIVNRGPSGSPYFSSAAPIFDLEQIKTLWPLPSQQEKQREVKMTAVLRGDAGDGCNRAAPERPIIR